MEQIDSPIILGEAESPIILPIDESDNESEGIPALVEIPEFDESLRAPEPNPEDLSFPWHIAFRQLSPRDIIFRLERYINTRYTQIIGSDYSPDTYEDLVYLLINTLCFIQHAVRAYINQVYERNENPIFSDEEEV